MNFVCLIWCNINKTFKKTEHLKNKHISKTEGLISEFNNVVFASVCLFVCLFVSVS